MENVDGRTEGRMNIAMAWYIRFSNGCIKTTISWYFKFEVSNENTLLGHGEPDGSVK